MGGVLERLGPAAAPCFLSARDALWQMVVKSRKVDGIVQQLGGRKREGEASRMSPNVFALSAVSEVPLSAASEKVGLLRLP